MWILWKMRLWKCKFSENWDFENVNNEILKLWILWNMRLWKCEFCQKWDFQYANFCDKLRIFALVWCSLKAIDSIFNWLNFELLYHCQSFVNSPGRKTSDAEHFCLSNRKKIVNDINCRTWWMYMAFWSRLNSKFISSKKRTSVVFLHFPFMAVFWIYATSACALLSGKLMLGVILSVFHARKGMRLRRQHSLPQIVTISRVFIEELEGFGRCCKECVKKCSIFN